MSYASETSWGERPVASWEGDRCKERVERRSGRARVGDAGREEEHDPLGGGDVDHDEPVPHDRVVDAPVAVVEGEETRRVEWEWGDIDVDDAGRLAADRPRSRRRDRELGLGTKPALPVIREGGERPIVDDRPRLARGRGELLEHRGIQNENLDLSGRQVDRAGRLGEPVPTVDEGGP